VGDVDLYAVGPQTSASVPLLINSFLIIGPLESPGLAELACFVDQGGVWLGVAPRLQLSDSKLAHTVSLRDVRVL
jgi:hypothetical protein